MPSQECIIGLPNRQKLGQLTLKCTRLYCEGWKELPVSLTCHFHHGKSEGTFQRAHGSREERWKTLPHSLTSGKSTVIRRLVSLLPFTVLTFNAEWTRAFKLSSRNVYLPESLVADPWPMCHLYCVVTTSNGDKNLLWIRVMGIQCQC